MQFHYTDADPAADRITPITEGFCPLHDRILVKRLAELGEAASSFLYVPECAQRLSVRGIVVAVGPGKRYADGHRRPLDVKPGDLIEFGRFTDFDDGNLLLIQEADVVGVIQDAQADSPDSAQAPAPATGETETEAGTVKTSSTTT